MAKLAVFWSGVVGEVPCFPLATEGNTDSLLSTSPPPPQSPTAKWSTTVSSAGVTWANWKMISTAQAIKGLRKSLYARSQDTVSHSEVEKAHWVGVIRCCFHLTSVSFLAQLEERPHSVYEGSAGRSVVLVFNYLYRMAQVRHISFFVDTKSMNEVEGLLVRYSIIQSLVAFVQLAPAPVES